MIFEGVRPFIDGRAELYGDKFIGLFLDIAHPDPGVLKQTLVSRDIAWTILAPLNPAIVVMDTMPGWRRLYSDRYSVVHVRDAPPS
jgi:hypothetical protein